MQVVGMYGYVDKYNFVIAVARTINIMDRSVLVIDATSDKKYKYIIPAIENKEKYLTRYGDVDFAIGFENYEELSSYLQENNIDINSYSYVLIDIDNADTYEKFSSLEVNKAYLYIDTNLVSVNKNQELKESKDLMVLKSMLLHHQKFFDDLKHQRLLFSLKG